MTPMSRSGDDADDSAEGQEHLLAVPAPPTEVVPLNLATRLGLVDARPEAEPEPEQARSPGGGDPGARARGGRA